MYDDVATYCQATFLQCQQNGAPRRKWVDARYLLENGLKREKIEESKKYKHNIFNFKCD